jgi:mannose-6-phosphate isomerase class I
MNISTSPGKFAESCKIRQYVKIPPLLKEKSVWGNPDGLKRAIPNADMPRENRWGEGWLLSALKEGSNSVEIQGKKDTLYNFLESGLFTVGYTRAEFPFMRFPFLVKIFSASDPLSLHTHPNFDNLIKNFPHAKIEFFMALEKTDMITGFKSDAAMARVKKVIREGALEPLQIRGIDHSFIRENFKFSTLQEGDLFCTYGLPHNVLNGTVLEISDSCNTTYRLTDFGRGREVHSQEFLDNVFIDNFVKAIALQLGCQNRRIAEEREYLKGTGLINLISWPSMDVDNRFPGTGFKPVINFLNYLKISKGDNIDLSQRARELGSVSPYFRGLILGFYFVLNGKARFEPANGLQAASQTLAKGEAILCPASLEKTKITADEETEILLLERRVDLQSLDNGGGRFGFLEAEISPK